MSGGGYSGDFPQAITMGSGTSPEYPPQLRILHLSVKLEVVLMLEAYIEYVL